MASGPGFPAFLRLEHQRDGSAKASFLAEVAYFTNSAETQFKRSFAEISLVVDRAIAGFKGVQFGINFDLPGLRQSAADAAFATQRLTAMRDAALELQRANGDNSEATARYVTALRAQVSEAQQAEQAAARQVSVYSRMQAELDKTVAANARLADSYRATFLEQARAENAAHRAQQNVNALAAPGLTRRATDNGAGYGALAELVRSQDEAERALAQTTAQAQAQQAEFNRLRQVESGAAEGARLLAAAHAGTALALGHTTTSARESAAAFELLFQAQAARTEAARRLLRERRRSAVPAAQHRICCAC